MIKITLEKVLEYQGKKYKKIHFATFGETILSESRFRVHFSETIEHLFPFPLYQDSFEEDARWHPISTQEEYNDISTWMEQQGERVFLRDCLYSSIALAFRCNKEQQQTYIGDLEYKAKENQDENAINVLVQECIKAIQSYKIYNDADLIAAVPPSLDKPSQMHLPSKIAKSISQQINKPDITSTFKMIKPKKAIKNLQLHEKWAEWEKTGLSYPNNLSGKNIILIDDKYQSGVTIQYVASTLQTAGANQIYGLYLVKNMRDTDNQ